MTFKFFRLQKELIIEELRDGKARNGRAGQFRETICHPAFQHQPGVEDDVSILERGKVVPCGLVHVWIDPFTHQSFDFAFVTNHLFHDVRDHGASRHDLVGRGQFGVFLFLRVTAGEEKEREGEEREESCFGVHCYVGNLIC